MFDTDMSQKPPQTVPNDSLKKTSLHVILIQQEENCTYMIYIYTVLYNMYIYTNIPVCAFKIVPKFLQDVAGSPTPYSCSAPEV